MSRPTFYQAESAFASEGLLGLLPKQRGPKGAHKLNSVVMAFIEERLQRDGSIRARALAQEIETKLKLSIHPRSIERALARKKNRRRFASIPSAIVGACSLRSATGRHPRHRS